MYAMVADDRDNRHRSKPLTIVSFFFQANSRSTGNLYSITMNTRCYKDKIHVVYRKKKT